MAPRRRKRKGIPLDGILLVDKPTGWTSHDVVNFVRGRYRLAKVGHGGTLDPMATGLLVLLLGKGTKSSETVMRGEKVYEGTVRLGAITDSQDADGDVVETRPVPDDLTRDAVEEVLARFKGDIEQIPPMVSAVKKDGERLYKKARKGEVVERDPRPVTIHELALTNLRPGEFDIRVRCTKGTYIRTLAHDIGEALGCGAHLSALRRTASGDFRVDDAIDVEALRDMDLESMKSLLLPVPDSNPPPKPITASMSLDPASLPLVTDLAALPDPESPLVLAVGAFDGVHLGHEGVFSAAKSLAAKHGARAGVLRFYPHPAKVLHPDKAPPLLCTEEQVHPLLARLGLDLHVRLPFDETMASREPEAFLDMLFSGIPGLRGLVVGPNWRFGRNGRGDVDLLCAFAAERDIQVQVAEGTQWEGELVSSTRIRNALREGDLVSASAMLDRNYTLQGTVRHGRRFGRELGFPTANFIPAKVLLPPSGVYAMRARVRGQSHPAAGYITHEPRLVEVHLLDFTGDLYGEHLEVELLSHLRPATPISDPDVLRSRIETDVADIRTLFKQ